MPLFGAAIAAPNKGITILSDLDLYHQCEFLQKIEEFKDISRPMCNFQVLFKAYFIFKDFSRKLSKFKYFSSLWEPWDLPQKGHKLMKAWNLTMGCQ